MERDETMKNATLVGLAALLLGMLGGCSGDRAQGEPQKHPDVEQREDGQPAGKEEDKANESREGQSSGNDSSGKDQALTQAEVLQEIRSELKTELEKVLPAKVPLKKGEHLTARTDSTPEQYEVTFYSAGRPIPVNNAALTPDNKDLKKIAVLKVKKYRSLEEADKAIAFENYSEAGGQKADLGHAIIGYQDAGAGSHWISWNEGRWDLAARTTTSHPEKGLDLARQTVGFLEEHTLPIPKEHGLVRLDAAGNSHFAKWAKGEVVYEMNEVSSSMTLLELAVSFK